MQVVPQALPVLPAPAAAAVAVLHPLPAVDRATPWALVVRKPIVPLGILAVQEDAFPRDALRAGATPAHKIPTVPVITAYRGNANDA